MPHSSEARVSAPDIPEQEEDFRDQLQQREEDEDFGFEEQTRARSLKSVLKQPVTLVALGILLAIAAGVVYLELSVFQGLPLPEVSYSLLPNEGRTKGVPVAIKVGQIAVFMINDPVEGGAANRAQAVVEKLQAGINRAVENPGMALTLDFESETPGIILQNPDGSNREVLIRLTEQDVKLSGDTDPRRVARLWAERLTDAIKLTGFGEPPEFTAGTEFGDTLQTLYTQAHAAEGRITKASLDEAFESLPPAQKETLETLPAWEGEGAQEETEQASGK